MGRHKGSKNKKTLQKEQQKEVIIYSISVRDLKKRIRELRKVKLSLRAGDKQRIELHRQIKDLKVQLTERKEVNKEKEDIIVEILKLKPQYIKDIHVDYTKHSIEDLQKHLNRIKN